MVSTTTSIHLHDTYHRNLKHQKRIQCHHVFKLQCMLAKNLIVEITYQLERHAQCADGEDVKFRSR